jgi:hypothetical protein
MKFGSLDLLIQRCEGHLDVTGTRNTDIENYFVQFLLIRICAEYEARVTALVQRRCSRPKDSHLRAFAQQTAEYVCKRFDISDIGKVLARFGDDYRQAFHGQAMSGTAHVSWNNIYSNRQSVAHEAGTQMSLGDLKANYADSLAVLDALAVALELRPGELRRFK